MTKIYFSFNFKGKSSTNARLAKRTAAVTSSYGHQSRRKPLGQISIPHQDPRPLGAITHNRPTPRGGIAANRRPVVILLGGGA